MNKTELQEKKEWATNECAMWLDNDENLYIRARNCKTAASLRRLWSNWGPFRVLNKQHVNFGQLFANIQADKAQCKSALHEVAV